MIFDSLLGNFSISQGENLEAQRIISFDTSRCDRVKMDLSDMSRGLDFLVFHNSLRESHIVINICIRL
jgi:hypothetical protein